MPLFSVGTKGKYGEIKRAVKKNVTDTCLIDIKTKPDIITKKPYLISQPQLNKLRRVIARSSALNLHSYVNFWLVPSRLSVKREVRSTVRNIPKFKDRANWSRDTFQPMRRRACVYQQTNQNIAPVIKIFQNNGQSRTESVNVSRFQAYF